MTPILLLGLDKQDGIYVERGKALLFRDGIMQEIYWTTRSAEYEKTTGRLRPIRFIDADGNPFPLKPGNTWINLIGNSSTLVKSDGTWKFTFSMP